ncbi:hypothetical protein [Mycobacterium sp. HUMS_1102779]|uniref:hypothetical protein n=1 Tax=Mycobacterium sp. HUMS_1102779 TaxID=3383487 RepID=UPI003899BCBA
MREALQSMSPSPTAYSITRKCAVRLFLTVGRLQSLEIRVYSSVDGADVIVVPNFVAEGWHNPLAPAGSLSPALALSERRRRY